MGWRAAQAVVLVALILGATAPLAGGSHARSCERPGTEAVYANGYGLLTVRHTGRPGYLPNNYFYGCSWRVGVVYRYPPSEEPDTDEMRLPSIKGPYAGLVFAYFSTSCDCVEDGEIDVWDLRTGHFPLRISPNVLSVEALVMTPSGSVAWIARDLGRHYRTTLTVSLANRAGGSSPTRRDARFRDPAAPLDRGRTIDPRSLRLSGNTVTWRHGRIIRSHRIL